MTPKRSPQIPAGLKKDWKRLAQEMKDAGWTFEMKNHRILAFSPDGETTLALPLTPSDRRAILNQRAAFERAEKRRKS